MYKVGIGYDVHSLEIGKPFILGGVKLNHRKGSVGHSDADVLIHAICDALLGALNLRDIGFHFPDNEKKYDNLTIQTGVSTISSIESGQELQFANFNKAEEEKAREQQYQVNNDEIKKIMQEMKWKPKRVMHGLKP